MGVLHTYPQWSTNTFRKACFDVLADPVNMYSETRLFTGCAILESVGVCCHSLLYLIDINKFCFN